MLSLKNNQPAGALGGLTAGFGFREVRAKNFAASSAATEIRVNLNEFVRLFHALRF